MDPEMTSESEDVMTKRRESRCGEKSTRSVSTPVPVVATWPHPGEPGRKQQMRTAACRRMACGIIRLRLNSLCVEKPQNVTRSMSGVSYLTLSMKQIRNQGIFGCAKGGGRTLTRFEPDWILSPARLPIPPLWRFRSATRTAGWNLNAL